MHVAGAVAGLIVAQGVQILSAAFGQAFERALHTWENFKEVPLGLDRWIDQCLRLQIDAARLLQKAKGESGNDAKRFLRINAATRKSHGHVLLHAVMFRNIREIDRRLEHGGMGRSLWADGLDAKRKRWQGQLFVVHLDQRADRLARENVLWQLQAHLDAGKSDRRENAGHQDNGDQTREDQE